MSEGPAERTSIAPPFRPSWWLRSPHLQTALASSGLRRWIDTRRGMTLDAAAEEHLLDGGDGVRLQGFHNRPSCPPRGLVVLFHGWEGCHESSYLVAAGARLLGEGYEIFRLNFRDHGETHHLNEGLFHSCRIDEVVQAVRCVTARCATRPLFLVGFSLGGNFALRVALRARAAGFEPAHVVAVSPVVDPERSLRAMESRRMYERYFLRKWSRSLRRKQRLFPRRYDLDGLLRSAGLRELTRELVQRYGGFPSLDAYLEGYSIAGARLAGLAVPATVVTAEDDPIIPVGDFRALDGSPRTRVEILPRGGHVGFLESVTLRSWIDRRIVAALAASPAAGSVNRGASAARETSPAG